MSQNNTAQGSQPQEGEPQRSSRQQNLSAGPSVQLAQDARTRHTWAESSTAPSISRTVAPRGIPQFDISHSGQVTAQDLNRRAPSPTGAVAPRRPSQMTGVVAISPRRNTPVPARQPQRSTFEHSEGTLGAGLQHMLPDGGLTVQVDRLRDAAPRGQPQPGAAHGTMRHIRASESQDPALRGALSQSRRDFDDDTQRRASEEAALRQTLRDSLRTGQQDMLRWYGMDEESLARNFYRRRTRWACGHEVDNGFTDQRRQGDDAGVLFQDEPRECPECAAAGLGLARSGSAATETVSTMRSVLLAEVRTATRSRPQDLSQSAGPVRGSSAVTSVNSSLPRQSTLGRSHATTDAQWHPNLASQSQSSRQTARGSRNASTTRAITTHPNAATTAPTANQSPFRVPTSNLPRWTQQSQARGGNSNSSSSRSNNNAASALRAPDWTARPANHNLASASGTRAASSANRSAVASGSAAASTQRSREVSQIVQRMRAMDVRTRMPAAAGGGATAAAAAAAAADGDAAGTGAGAGGQITRLHTGPADAPAAGRTEGRTVAVDWAEVRRVRLGRFGTGGDGGAQ